MNPPKIETLVPLLADAQRRGYAVGAFSPRCTPVIVPVLQAGQQCRSPLIIQIAEIELKWHQLTIEEFAEAFFRAMETVNPTVPVCLHLDHTKSFQLIQAAIRAGFTSVMIDASDKELKDNICAAREVVEYAHSYGVSVEAELGRIGSADFMETDRDEELFTDPSEAAYFVEQTGIDALAVSVGTAHGVYKVRQPRIDVDRLMAIRSMTSIPMVLHGGSGTPNPLLQAAIRIPGGGVSKINIATDLELALLDALQRSERVSNAELAALPLHQLNPALDAVRQTVIDKIINSLGSNEKAD